MWLKIKLGLAAAGALAISILWFMLGQSRKRAERAERQVKVRDEVAQVEHAAADAGQRAKEEGDAHVEAAVERAATDSRDYFE